MFRKKLADEFKSKREQHKVEKLIKASQERQKALFSVMEFRNQKMQELKQVVVGKLQGIEKHADYSKLLRNLIVQGLIRLQEDKVTVRVRKCDVAAAEKVLAEAEKLYKKAVSDATGGFVPDLAPLTIDSQFLPPAHSADNNDDYCSGGIVLVARRGKILCKNTLDARLDIAFNKLTPSLRGMLFGERAPPPNAGKHDESAHAHH